MQLFRRAKQESEPKAVGQSQTNRASSWHESVDQQRQEPVDYAAQPAAVTSMNNGPAIDSPVPVAPDQPIVIHEQVRSMPPMSNVARENLPYPDLPVQSGSREARPTGQATVIDAQSHFNGNYRSDSDLIIEGAFEGEIECNGTVTVAENATMSATVRARNVVVAGSANGEITCDERFSVEATGEMRGKAQAATLVVEEGAFFEGEFRMGNGYSGAVNASYSGWESAHATPEPAAEYSMSVDDGELAELNEMDTGSETESVSVDDVWDEDEQAEE
jgi:cytoskeletal protein CcmA (bactofilin family)